MLCLSRQVFVCLLVFTCAIPTLAQVAVDTRPAAVLPTSNTEVDKYNDNYLKLTRSLMHPKSVSDTFGKRIAQRYIAMQLTIANRNSEFQWLVTDGAAHLTRLIDSMLKSKDTACVQRGNELGNLAIKAGGGTFPVGPNPTITGEDLTSLRGVAEKGQVLDPRNLTLRVLRGSGTIAAGLLAVTTFGPAFAPAVAMFNGPLITGYQAIFPDFTVNQLNRLNDEAYAANTVVGKQQAKVMVIFVPTALLLTREEQDQFFDDPHKTFGGCVDLRMLDAFVNGHYVTQLDPTPIVTSLTIDAAELGKFGTDNFKVAGTVVGRFLDNATLSLTGAPARVTIAPRGAATDTRLPFELSSAKAIAPHTSFTIVIKKDGLTATNYTLSTDYSPGMPTIKTGGLSPTSLTQEEKKAFTIIGTGFLPGSKMVFENRKDLTLGDVDQTSTTTTLHLDITAAEGAEPGPRKFWVESNGLRSGEDTLTIVKKQRPSVIDSLEIAPGEAVKFASDKFSIAGTLKGRYLLDASLSLTSAPPGMTITTSGSKTEESIGVVLAGPRAVAPNTTFTIVAAKSGLTSANLVAKPDYAASKATINAAGISPKSLAQGETKKFKVPGTGFTSDAEIVFTNPGDFTTATVDKDSATTELTINLAAAAAATPGSKEFVIRTVGNSTAKAAIAINKK